MDMQRMIVDATPDYETTNVPKGKVRRAIHALVGHNKFDVFIMSCIVGNMIQMGIQYEGASDQFIQNLDKFNLFFSIVFLLECILKLIAYGKTYFSNNWQVFDFCVVFTSMLDILMGFLNAGSLRFLRIGP